MSLSIRSSTDWCMVEVMEHEELDSIKEDLGVALGEMMVVDMDKERVLRE